MADTDHLRKQAVRTDVVTHATKAIRGYDPVTGKELWKLTPNSEVTTPTPIVAHGLVYITNGYRGIQPIYAVKPGATGDISLKEGQTSNEYIAWSNTARRPLHAYTGDLRRPDVRRE